MKIKSLLVYSLVGGAFLAVSLIVWFSKGKNVRALKAKYRLGGILIATTALLGTAACSGACYDVPVTCYMPPLTPNTLYPNQQPEQIYAGDSLAFTIVDPTFAHYSYTLHQMTEDSDKPGKLIEQGSLRPIVDSDAENVRTPGYFVKLGHFTYTGKARMSFYAEKTAEVKLDSLLYSQDYLIAAGK